MSPSYSIVFAPLIRGHKKKKILERETSWRTDLANPMAIRLPFRIFYSILFRSKRKKENFCFSQASFYFGCQSSKKTLLTWLTLPLVTRRPSLIVAILLAIVSKRRERERRRSILILSIACRKASCPVLLIFLKDALPFCLQCLVCLLGWNRSVDDNTTFITWRLV